VDGNSIVFDNAIAGRVSAVAADSDAPIRSDGVTFTMLGEGKGT
jgi:hypothetical protein